ncbi:helix-turn-helix domain-containing protein [Mucilaginibacter pocheonensis]|uniref:AraC-like DNA-binding protein n=1 Tax=Mucilaginibacter pocheonensis TaxID=398050 RepID=A0ABU1T6R3_9SPHI|nr:helix-turn-helix domain-containing protein [Mucilaginibacter pocheonensis]MDR6941080.1 AraC-like DNA-binding protein [Mucilaginibacter pocheonensis]
MEYRQIPPPDYLKNYIRFFWTLEINEAGIPSRLFRTVAEGCPGLIFQSPEKGTMYQFEKELPSIFIYGQSTRHAEIQFGGSFTTIGICFYPNALKTIFGFDADELTDTCTCLDLLARKDGYLLAEQLMDAALVADQIEVICAYLFFKLRKNNRYEDQAMQFAISRIIQSKGSVSLQELRGYLQLSERSFERKFKQYVGIPPKLFCRISRFQAALNELRFGKHEKLTDVAYGNEYADQSHFIRAFKEFAGCSPLQYQRSSMQAVENFYEKVK